MNPKQPPGAAGGPWPRSPIDPGDLLLIGGTGADGDADFVALTNTPTGKLRRIPARRRWPALDGGALDASGAGKENAKMR